MQKKLMERQTVAFEKQANAIEKMVNDFQKKFLKTTIFINLMLKYI